ncbi:sigma-54 dependent transcriptional regulator [Phycisphaeraceae bacterium D3-23]
MLSVLIVGEQRQARHRLAAVVEQNGLSARAAGSITKAREAMEKYGFAAVFIDCEVDDALGLEALAALPLGKGQTVVFLMDSEGGPLTEALSEADSAMFRVLPRNPGKNELSRILKTVKRRSARAKRTEPNSFEQMLGNSPEMLEVYNMIAKVAPTDAAVLICGESGTGKELVAGAIHQRSERSDGPFVAVNCGAIAENLIESELFGHEKGAFTGADKQHAGVFEQADGGTLFLDEVTEMPLEMQVRFLRVLETGTLRRLGAEKDKQVSVRVVAATNREPQDGVEQGTFREDLMYRLAVFPIALPPLRKRGDDVCLLAAHFLSLHNKEHQTEKRLTDAAQQRLAAYEWPGNVRQLRNMVQRAYILEDAQVSLDCLDDLIDGTNTGTCGDAVNMEHETEAPRDPSATHPPADTDAPAAGSSPDQSLDDTVVKVEVGTSIEDAEKQLILKTLDELGGNKTEAAKVLGISLKTLYNRLNAYGD